MAVTAKDVAEACGVSRITVNRALSGNENVKPETREKILKKAQEMGYVPNLIARSLVNGKSEKQERNMDYIVRATAADGQIRAFAATTRETVETARQNDCVNG